MELSARDLDFSPGTMPIVVELTPAIDPSFDTKIKVPLYEHQKRVLFLAKELEANTHPICLGDQTHLHSTVGILSCPPGSGKSITALSLALTASSSISSWKPQTLLTSGSVVGKSLPWLDTSLIVVPNMLIQQWSEYVDKFADIESWRWKVVKTSIDSGLYLSNPTQYKLLIVAADRFNDFPGHAHFKRVFFDEVDTLNIPACKKIDADRIWCLSSNYERIRDAQMQNRGFLRDIFSEFKRIGSRSPAHILWDAITIYTDLQYLQETMLIPSCCVTDILCKPMPPEIINVETPELAKLMNVGLERDIVHALGMRYLEDRVSAYTSLTSSIHDEMIQLNRQHGETGDVLNRLVGSMDDIRDRVLNTTICPITHNTINYPVITRCCQNMFEATYLLPWVFAQNTCPLCRASIPTSELIFIQTNQSLLMNKYETVAKWLLQHVANPAKRILICGHYSTLANLRAFLEAYRITFSSFHGRTLRRTIFQFQEGNPNVLLLDVKHYSTGLNLTMTTHMMLMDTFEDHVRTQVIGRAQRIGRVYPLQAFQIKDE